MTDSGVCVSVIIPTYNHAEYISEALQSVFAQTYVDYEVIVVNDGSLDDTAGRLAPFIEGAKIRYFEQSNAGPAAARNHGLANARGEFIAFLDADDRWPTDKLQWQVQALKDHRSAVLVYGRVQTFGSGNAHTYPPPNAPKGRVKSQFFREPWIHSPGQTLIRKDALRQINGFDPLLQPCEDWDLWLRLADEGDFLFEHRLALYYRRHATNATRDRAKVLADARKVIRKHLGAAPTPANTHDWHAAQNFLLQFAADATKENVGDRVQRGVLPSSPRMTVCLTTYNRSHYLPAAIESVLNQTHSDFELLVWDDGSTDNTLDVARGYAERDSRVIVMAGAHRGQSHSLKSVTSLARGTYLGWLDDDDMLAPTALEETAAVLDANPGVGMVYTQCMKIDEEGKPIAVDTRTRTPYSKSAMLVNFMTFHFRLMRSRVFQQIGGVDENVPYVADYDMCLRLSEATEIHYLPKPLYLYRVHFRRMSREHDLDMIGESERAIRAALRRRKMDGEYDLDVQLQGIYTLRRRKQIMTKDDVSTTSNLS